MPVNKYIYIYIYIVFQDLFLIVPYKSLSGPAIVAGGDYAHLFLTRADTVTVRYTYHRHHYVHTYLSLRGIASSVVQSLGVTRGLPQEVTRVVPTAASAAMGTSQVPSYVYTSTWPCRRHGHDSDNHYTYGGRNLHGSLGICGYTAH